MTIYAGLDVSDKTTHICVVDVDGAVIRRDVVASDPDALAKWLKKHCKGLMRAVLETGSYGATCNNHQTPVTPGLTRGPALSPRLEGGRAAA